MATEVFRSIVKGVVIQRPPSPPVGMLGGHYRAFRRNPAEFLRTNAESLGRIFYFRLGPQHAYCITDPSLIKEVLVAKNDHFKKGRALQRAKRLLGEGLLTSEGEAHRRQRRLVLPAFHRERISAYATTMIEYAERTPAEWQDGVILDIDKEMMRLTLGIVGKTLFNADVSEDADQVGQAMTNILEMFHLLLLPFSELLEKLPLPQTRRFDRARDQLDAVMYRLIRERREEQSDHGDLLSMLLAARDEAEDGTGLSDEQIRDEALTLFIAGHETTANLLTWTWYLLSQSPDAERRLHEEVDAVFDRHGELLPEHYGELAYTERVISESMRLFPPAWTIGRMALRDVELGGYLVPERSLVLLNIYGLQRDPGLFDSPTVFDPDRWLPANAALRDPYSYVPFGGGVRRCIGENFAWMEGVLILAAIARNWRFRLVSDQKVGLKPLMTLRPKYGMRMKLERR